MSAYQMSLYDYCRAVAASIITRVPVCSAGYICTLGYPGTKLDYFGHTGVSTRVLPEYILTKHTQLHLL